MKYDLLYGRSAFCIPGGALENLAKASQNDLRVLIALGSGRFANEKEMATYLEIDEGSVVGSMEFWRGAGVLDVHTDIAVKERMAESPKKTAKAPASGRDDYTSAEIDKKCGENPTLMQTIEMCQTILGKTFTKTEISSIVYLSDHLRLEDEYIMMLCTYCKKRGKSSLSYIQKVGCELYDADVTTVKSLDIYIKNEVKKQETEYKIRKLFGMGERALAPKEKAFISKWTSEWNLPFEIIEKAYEVMVGAIERPTLAYENGIIEKWRSEGCKTIEDVEGLLASQKKTSKKQQDVRETSFDLDEFFDLAVQRGAGKADNTEE